MSELFKLHGEPLVGEDPITGRMLTEPTAPYSNGTTSRAAAEKIAPSAAALREQVLAFIRSRGTQGATDEEVQDALGMLGNTQRPRRGELVDSGHVRDSHQTRGTKSGRAAKVWVAKEFFCQ